MVTECLHLDPAKRPSAETILKYLSAPPQEAIELKPQPLPVVVTDIDTILKLSKQSNDQKKLYQTKGHSKLENEETQKDEMDTNISITITEDEEDSTKNSESVLRLQKQFHAILDKRKLFFLKILTLEGVISWTVQDVGVWLICNQLSEYSKIFVGQEINGEALLFIQDSDFSDLGVHKVGHRVKLRQLIKELQEREKKCTVVN